MTRMSLPLLARSLMVVLLAATGLGGCATGAGPSPGDLDPSEVITIRIDNQSSSRYRVSYSFRLNTRRPVGDSRGGTVQTIQIMPQPGNLRMILESSGVETVTSNPVEAPRAGETYQLLITNTRAPELRLWTQGGD